MSRVIACRLTFLHSANLRRDRSGLQPYESVQIIPRISPRKRYLLTCNRPVLFAARRPALPPNLFHLPFGLWLLYPELNDHPTPMTSSYSSSLRPECCNTVAGSVVSTVYQLPSWSVHRHVRTLLAPKCFPTPFTPIPITIRLPIALGTTLGPIDYPSTSNASRLLLGSVRVQSLSETTVHALSPSFRLKTLF